jgi:hypothetical protein
VWGAIPSLALALAAEVFFQLPPDLLGTLALEAGVPPLGLLSRLAPCVPSDVCEDPIGVFYLSQRRRLGALVPLQKLIDHLFSRRQQSRPQLIAGAFHRRPPGFELSLLWQNSPQK